MSDDDFLAALVAPQARGREGRGAARATKPDSRCTPEARCVSAKTVSEAGAEFDVATLPPIESINALTDVTAFLQQGRAGRADPCGASTRMDRRSGDPRFRRACRERLGLHRS